MPRKDPEARRAYMREYAARNREAAKKRAADWYAAHKDDPEFKAKHEERGKKWKEEHREEWLAWRRERYAERMKDPEFRAAKVREATKGKAKQLIPHRQLLADAKASGCLACGEREESCLEFHHKDPAAKSFTIGRTLYRVPALDVLAAEIAKCVVLCASCHKKFHAGAIDLPLPDDEAHLRRWADIPDKPSRWRPRAVNVDTVPRP